MLCVSGVQQSESVIHMHISTLFYKIILLLFFFFLAIPMGMLLDLRSLTRDQPVTPPTEAWSLNHWGCQESPSTPF